MRSQIARLIDIGGLALSGMIPIVVLTTSHDFIKPNRLNASKSLKFLMQTQTTALTIFL
ncbi:MAG: hypothetical protein MUC48_15795 [Leptolyngbya sp. Prado105]|jgi:hypothetical protein|nr:hypothetical protein [Leptolyngbya sp. Prado105]